MKPFEIVKPKTLADAAQALGTQRDQVKLLAGGTDLLGEMKDYIVTPSRLVNLKALPELRKLESDSKGGLKIGALVTLTELAENVTVQKSFPALAEAIAVTAMPQIRNMATIGGNLCQRPRCWYYRDEHTHCLRKGGSRCFAVEGENQYHAILGGGPCYIVHPSDPAPALIALGASVVIHNGKTSRTVPLEKFFVLPEQDPHRENILKQNEIVTQVVIPAPAAGSKSAYLKERERDSHDWALTAAAVSVVVKAGVIKSARVCLGGVAPAPWRATAAEKALIGKAPTAANLAAAAKAATMGAVPMDHNAYKIPLTQVVVERALARVV